MQDQMHTMTIKVDEAEERISDTKDKTMENMETEKKKRETKVLDHECRFREISSSLKCNNICTIGIPEEKEKEKGAEVLFEQIVAENLPNLGNKTDIKIQEAQRTHIKFNKS